MKKTRFLSIVVALMALSLPEQPSALILGPYDGKVIDSQTGEPIEGASVLFFWQKRIFQIVDSTSEFLGATLVDKIAREKAPNFIRLGKDSILLPLIAKLPIAITDALLSKRFGLNRL